MFLLTNTNETFEVLTSAAGSVMVTAAYADITTTTFVPGASQSAITTGTTTTVVSAPAASTQRQIKQITIHNDHTTSNTVRLMKDVAGTEYHITGNIPLQPQETLQYVDGDGFKVIDASGRIKVTDSDNSGSTGITSAFFKVGTAAEAAGVWYSWAKDKGNPGAWAPGTPGLNGRATDGTTTTDNGCIKIRDATGNNYLTSYSMVTNVVCNPWLFDVLWVNSGLVVTTLTAQAIAAPVALPARDVNGSTNGEGVWAGILVTTATTNAAAIATMTMSYTNSDGVAGKTASIASYPATAVIGTVVWYQLAAGDKGVRSIQSVTNPTSLVAGAISLILARPLCNQAALVANVGGASAPPQSPGIKLYSGACVLPIGLMSTTTATNIAGTIQVMDR